MSHEYFDATVYPMSAMVIFLIFVVVLVGGFSIMNQWDSPYQLDYSRNFGRGPMYIWRGVPAQPNSSPLPGSIVISPEDSKSQAQFQSAACHQNQWSRQFENAGIPAISSKNPSWETSISVQSFLKRT